MKELTPFNIELMFAPDSVVRNMRPVTRTDIYDGVTSNFHEDGLFSITTFGRVGMPERDNNFSYIRLNAQVIHPAVFEVLKKLKKLYIDIIMGTAYAVWDNEAKDFVLSDMIDGDTGFAFFTRHIHHLEPDKRSSKKRNMYVDVFNKYKRECLMHNCLVIPAGLRDLYVDGSGKEVQDEINDMYRKLIAIANSINTVGGKMNDPAVDITRRNMQLTMNEIYNYLKNMLSGKKGLVQAKWGGRKLVNGTRNVISMMNTSADELHGLRAPGVDDTHVGLYQTMKGAAPFVIYEVRKRFIEEVFTSPQHPTTLIDRNTFKLIPVDLHPDVWDKWGTSAGLEKLIEGFSDDTVRNKPIMISGCYLWLVYEDEHEYRLFRDINELPDPKMKEKVHPMTYAEFFYLSNPEKYYTFKVLITRYPIDSFNSIYPSNLYLKTTGKAYLKYELGEDWKTRIAVAREFPSRDQNASWLNTVAISPTRLSSLGADFDGDKIYTVSPNLSNCRK